ncbi:MAG: hydroxysqualene dehydroxylase HpnE [Zymomonas mobilis]|uniref:Squalene-associated FAD-dependent desaturase n=1 Tax=Zymomonas mobilis TaxID=542 RepID=A0A542W137_ZYMMB|nr:hydroxysqualene dehydroxylase HpnE [Zymomonas mobilis]TQL17292.1 squalene-associated FAD-dependent desaturase [Zymomonas mobilis]
MSVTHIVGAGLAGLAAAVAITHAGGRVKIYEASSMAGGRARSYHDKKLDIEIDNGNHMLLSGNHSAATYLKRIGAEHNFKSPKQAAFSFCDLSDKERFTIKLSDGLLPWWVLRPNSRVPHSKIKEYFGLLSLLLADHDAKIGDIIPDNTALWHKLLDPFFVSVLNTPAKEGAACLAAAVIRETLIKGGKACIPRIAYPNLASSFIDPALLYLKGKGVEVDFHHRLRQIHFSGQDVEALEFAHQEIKLEKGDKVIIALPAWVVQSLLPDIETPDKYQAIINAHFLMTPTAAMPHIMGVVGGTADWIFTFENRISVTISAANHLLGLEKEELVKRIWDDIQEVHAFKKEMPAWQVVTEKRATFEATVEQNNRRPPAVTPWNNLFLAGNWVRTGLPATIEGAIRSGQTAADLILSN